MYAAVERNVFDHVNRCFYIKLFNLLGARKSFGTQSKSVPFGNPYLSRAAFRLHPSNILGYREKKIFKFQLDSFIGSFISAF